MTRVERARWWRVVAIGAPLLLGAWFGSRTWSLVAGQDIRTGEDQLARLEVVTPPSALLVWDARTPSHAALAAQYAFGRESFLAHPASPAGGAVRELVSRVGARTPVRLVVDGRDGTSGQEWRRSLPDVEMTPAGELPLRYDRAVSIGRTARWSIAPVDRLLQIYALQPTSHAAPAALPVRVDVGTADLPYLVDGFHGAENSNGRSCRWTRATARLRLPPNAAPAGTPLRATLELAAARPAGVTATLDVFWNGRHAATLRPGAGFDTYVIALGSSSGGPDELALRSDAFVPSRTGSGNDDRSLGVLVDVITVDRVE